MTNLERLIESNRRGQYIRGELSYLSLSKMLGMHYQTILTKVKANSFSIREAQELVNKISYMFPEYENKIDLFVYLFLKEGN